MTSLPPEPAPLSSPDTSSTALLERELLEQPVEPGDHERFAHYAHKNKIMESALTGTPVVALCGKIWVPGRDPKKFPVCPACKELMQTWRSMEGPGDSGSGSGSSD